MVAAIIAWLSQTWFGDLVSAALSWWSGRTAAQNAADQAESTAEAQHNADGAQSVADQQSDDAQNAALDKLENDIDNPPPPSQGAPK